MLHLSVFKGLCLWFGCFLTLIQATDVVTTWDHSGDGSASGSGADTTVEEHASSTSFGSGRLQVRFNRDISHQRNSIAALRFDISQMNALAEDQAYGLELYDLRYNEATKADGKSYNLWVLTDTAQNNWSEATSTWQSGFPGHADDGTPFNGPDFTGDVTFLQSFTFRASGNQGWSEPVTLSAASMQTLASIPGTERTFFVTTSTESGTQYRFASKENADAGVGALAPRLSLQPAPVEIEENFGWTTRGGYGGQVLKVTNLNASGPGSFREALETPGPRIIVFEVGGVIDLGGRMNEPEWVVTEPYLTIAGQTAPSPGITLIKGGLSIQTHDVIVQHLRIRPGDVGFAKRSGWEPDALNATGAHNVIFEHVSATWSTDEGISVSGPRNVDLYQTSYNVTLSHCLIGEVLDDSTHAKGRHSKGSLIHDHVRSVAILGCLYASNADRNPYFKAETTGIVANNLIYNPDFNAIQYGYTSSELNSPPESAHLTVVGNHYRQGPNSNSGVPLVRITHSSVGDIYLSDNIAQTQTGSALPIISSGSFPQRAEPIVWPEGFVAMPAGEVWDHVLAHAGARPNERNVIDERIRNSVRNNTGAIIDSQSDVGGYPSLIPTSHTLTVPTGGADAVEAWLQAWSAKWEPSSQQAFQAKHFTVSERWNSDISGDQADPEGDGRKNLLEFAQGLDPRVSDTDGSLTLEVNGSRAVVEFRNRISMSPVTLTLESSTDLDAWFTVYPNGTDILESVVDPDVDGEGLVEMKQIEMDLPAAGPRFFRLWVE